MEAGRRPGRMTVLPVPSAEPEPFDPAPAGGGLRAEPRWLGRATWAFVGLGVVLRVAMYGLDFPLWWDEAFVAVNLLRRGYLDLLRPLDYGQVCPLLFLWAELAAARLLGFSEWSLRLFPLGCAVAGVFLFRAMARQVVRGRAELIAVAVLAVSVHPIRHAADLKPYATDLLAAVVLQGLALGWLRDRGRPGRLWGLAGFVPFALLASHPAAFVAGGVGAALAWPAWRSGRRGVRSAFLAYGLAMMATSAWVYVGFTRAQASASGPGMGMMWARSFPPLDSPLGLVRWLATVHTGDMLAYPCGGERGASTLGLGLAIAGAVAIGRRGRFAALGVLVGPLGLALIAAALRRYPYGGPAPHGSAARVMQYAAPGLCLLIGVGAASLLARVGSDRLRGRITRIGLSALIVIGLVPIVEGARHPYRAYQAHAAREFARRFWPEVGSGAEVACLRWDLGVAEWDSVRLGIAVATCNQAIESPSRRAGGPDYRKVSAGHPLRCVLAAAPERDGPEVEAWLNGMAARFDLRSRATVVYDAAEPGRRPVPERFEVFEFVPRAGPGQPPASIGP